MDDIHFHSENTQPKFPWHKERLLTKCLQDPRNRPSLDSSYWRFLDVGLDDFRGGYPRPATETPSELRRGASPLIFNGMPSTSCAVGEGCRTKRLSKQQACFSKHNVQQQIHRQHVAAVEEKLKQHPLALHPHFEQCLAPELFDKVKSILDPDVRINKASPAPTPLAEDGEEEKEVNCTDPKDEEGAEEVDRRERGASVIDKINPEIQSRRTKNRYVGLQLNEDGAQEDQRVNNDTRLHSPSQDEDITKVTKLFCDWINSLGGETNNMTESAILDLFASGFEKKPSPSFPIQVINTDNLPDEQRRTSSALYRQYTNILLKDSAPYKRKLATMKPIYGAWYLDPKTWKRRDAGEPLQDPNVIPEELEFQNQASEKDEELKELLGTQAFKQFVISKGLEVPKFLSNLFPEEEQEPQARGGSSTLGSVATRKTVTWSVSKGSVKANVS